MTPASPRARLALTASAALLCLGGVAYQAVSPRWSFEALLAVCQGIALALLTLDSVAGERAPAPED